jgi:hypothetical protein
MDANNSQIPLEVWVIMLPQDLWKDGLTVPRLPTLTLSPAMYCGVEGSVLAVNGLDTKLAVIKVLSRPKIQLCVCAIMMYSTLLYVELDTEPTLDAVPGIPFPRFETHITTGWTVPGTDP